MKSCTRVIFIIVILITMASCQPINRPPLAPANPSPQNGATNLPTNLTLTWSCEEPDGDTPMTYDVHLGKTEETMEIVSSRQTGLQCEINNLEYSTTYYWKVIPYDSKGKKRDLFDIKIWRFATNKIPSVTKKSGPSGKISECSRKFTWDGNDPDGTIDHYEYRKDGGNWIDHGLNKSYTWNGYTEGSHSFEVRAKDNDKAYSNAIKWDFIFTESGPITVIGPWSGKEQDAFVLVLEKFEEKTGIIVQYQVYSNEDLMSLLPAQFEKGITPGDVIFMLPSFIQNNFQHIIELTNIINVKDFRTGSLDNVTSEDRVYGFSYTGLAKPGFWYRKSFFEEHDISVPETWNDFDDMLYKISEIEGIIAPIASGNGTGWPLSDVTEHFILTFGGSKLQNNLIEDDVKWTDTVVKEPMKELANLIQKDYFGEPIEWTTILEKWWNGSYALYFMGSWLTSMVDDQLDLGVFTLPGNKAAVLSFDYAFLPKYSKNIDEAKLLVKFLGGVEGQTIQVEQGGSIASVKGIKIESYPPIYRGMVSLLEDKDVANDLDDSIGGTWQTTFWNQLKLLWNEPDQLDSILQTLEDARN